MPIATVASELSGGFEQPFSQAGKVQIISYVGMPVAGQTIATSGSYVSPLIFADGFQVLTVAVTMDRAGTLLITRYIDPAGAIARPASSTPIAANIALIVDINDDLPFVAFTVEIDNGAVGPAVIAAFALIMNAD